MDLFYRCRQCNTINPSDREPCRRCKADLLLFSDTVCSDGKGRWMLYSESVEEGIKQEEARELKKQKELEEKQKQEEARKREKQKELEEKKKQEEARKLEKQKKLEEKQKWEEARKLEKQKKLEEKQKREEARKLEKQKKLEEEQKLQKTRKGKSQEKAETTGNPGEPENPERKTARGTNKPPKETPRRSMHLFAAVPLVLAVILALAAGLSTLVNWNVLIQPDISADTWIGNTLMADCPVKEPNTADQQTDGDALWQEAAETDHAVFGSAYLRSEIATITFQDQFTGAPLIVGETWDVSADGSGRVLAWVEKSESDGSYHLYIAANGGINASDCRGMFALYPNLTQIVFNDAFHTEQAVDMDHMFYKCESLEMLHPGQQFITANVTDMSSMFRDCGKLMGLELGDSFQTAKVTDMSSMFRGCGKLTGLELGDSFQTAKVTDMSSMFRDCGKLTRLELGDSFQTAKVTDMSTMFSGCAELAELTLGSGFHTGSATDLSGMFENCAALRDLDFSGFSMESTDSVERMFAGTSNFQPLEMMGVDWYEVEHYEGFLPGSDWQWLFAPNAWEGSILKEGDGYEVPGSDYDVGRILSVTVVHMPARMPDDNWWDISEDESGRVVAWVESSDDSDYYKHLYLAGYGGINAKNCEGLWRKYKNVQTIDLGGGFYTKYAKNMDKMFLYCEDLTKLDLGEHFDTSNVESMKYMFSDCKSLTKLDLGSSFDTGKVKDMKGMFQCSATLDELTLGSHFTTKNVTDLQEMFLETPNIKWDEIDHIRWNSRALCDEFMDGTDWKVLFWEQNVLMRDDPWEGTWDTEASDWFSCFEAPVLGNSNYKRNQIKTVTILDTLAGKPDNAWDVSEEGDGSVMAWVKANGNLYDLYIAGNGGVSASRDCKGLFAGYENVTGYSFGDAFHTDGVEYMMYMFLYNLNIRKIDISHFDTKLCEDMGWMFFDCKKLSELKAAPELFQSGNLKTVERMFWATSLTASDIDKIGWPSTAVEHTDFMEGSGWKSRFKKVND